MGSKLAQDKTMSALRSFIIAAAALWAAGHALAQNGERASTPPGQSQDGAAPSHGAIKGGTILPGETGGTPDRAKNEARCDELLGTLREECLERQRETAAGGTKPPSEAPDTRKR